jgi:ribonuclease P protein component
MGLPASLRLRRPAEFRDVLKKGERTGDRLLLVSALRTGSDRYRFGLSVSKRVGGAVVRNKVKRRLREALREMSGAGGGGWDVVVSARPAAAEAEFSELRQSALRLTAKLGIQTPAGG